MKTAFLLRCDGRRQYIEQAVTSAQNYIKADFDDLIIVDDSGDSDYAAFLESSFPEFRCIHHAERLGMAAGVRTAFEAVLATGADYVFATEDDFVFTRTTNVKKMARLLHCEGHLAQLVLKRNPVNEVEILAGGQIEVAPREYDDHECPSGNWVEHRTDGRALHVFSFNPSLIRRDAISVALSRSDNMLESGVTEALLSAAYRFAYYGNREDVPRCHHVGESRSAGYRW